LVLKRASKSANGTAEIDNDIQNLIKNRDKFVGSMAWLFASVPLFIGSLIMALVFGLLALLPIPVVRVILGIMAGTSFVFALIFGSIALGSTISLLRSPPSVELIGPAPNKE
jgi:hypothetical protein